jgi:hypothetical protein
MEGLLENIHLSKGTYLTEHSGNPSPWSSALYLCISAGYSRHSPGKRRELSELSLLNYFI